MGDVKLAHSHTVRSAGEGVESREDDIDIGGFRFEISMTPSNDLINCNDYNRAAVVSSVDTKEPPLEDTPPAVERAMTLP